MGGCALLGRGAGSPSNAMWPGPRSTCMPSFILIHPTVWLQTPTLQTETDRQTDTDRRLTAYGEPFYKWSTKKLKPRSVASYDIRPGNGEGLLWFRHFINVTYLLRQLLIYLQPGTITGRQTHDYRSDSMDFMTRPFLLSISFFCF